MIRRIEDLEQYKSLITNLRNRRPLINNNLMMNSKIENLVLSNNLFFSELSEGLVFYDTTESIVEIIMMLETLKSIDIPVMKESDEKFVLTLRDDQQKIDSIMLEFSGSDFDFVSLNTEMSLIITEDTKKLGGFDNLTIEKLVVSEIKEVREIMVENLDEQLNVVPAEEEIVERINYYYKISYKQEIIGGFYLEEANNSIKLEHLAIDETYQGRGIGAIVVSYICENNVGKKMSLWVDTENKPAVKLYEKFGMNKTNKRSLIYIRRK